MENLTSTDLNNILDYLNIGLEAANDYLAECEGEDDEPKTRDEIHLLNGLIAKVTRLRDATE
jgi:hypothetical protein